MIDPKLLKYALNALDIRQALMMANMATEAPGGGMQGLPAAFLDSNFNFDKNQLLSTLINTVATSPQLEQGIEDLYTQVPQAARVLETLRQNPVVRSRILGSRTEPFLTTLENKLKTAKFNKDKASVIQSQVGAQKLVDTKLKDSVSRAKAMQDYITLFNSMAKKHRGTSEELNKMVMAKLIEQDKEGAKLIAPATNDIISRNQMKPGMARVHGNVDRVRFKNMVKDLGNRYETDRNVAQQYSGMANQVGALGEQLGNMQYEEKPITGPRVNIRKIQEAMTNQEGVNMDKNSSLRDILAKYSSMEFLLSDLTPVSDVPKGRILRKRNFDEKGGIQEYVENRRANILKKRGFEDAKDEENDSPNSLVKYILGMDKE